MRNSDLLLIHHSASRQHAYPPNSPEAIRACLEAGARAIEVDISLLADGRFALLHGPLLERETTGSGPVGSHTGEQLRTQHYIWRGRVTDVSGGPSL